MITLKNDFLEVDIHPKGAEIHKMVGLSDQMNYMWKRDKAYWACIRSRSARHTCCRS